jgi:hypothetical protein
MGAVFGGDDARGLALVTAIWAGAFGLAGLVLGSCQPAKNTSLATQVQSKLSIWRRIGSWLYLLVVGGLLGTVTSHVIMGIGMVTAVSLDDPTVERRSPRTALQKMVPAIAVGATTTASLASVLGHVLGAFFGSAIRTDRPRSPVVRTSIYAGVISAAIGLMLGILPGVITELDIRQSSSQGSFELVMVSFFLLVVEFAIPAAIGGAVIGWRLAKRQVGIPTP